MKKTREDMVQELVQRVMMLGRYWRYSTHAAAGPEQLSPPQAHLMFVLPHYERGISVKELAEKFGITPGAVTQLANELVRRGMVVRESDPNDRRIVLLKVTDAARGQAKKLKEDFIGSMAAIFKPLDDEDIARLVEILSKLEISQDCCRPGGGDTAGG